MKATETLPQPATLTLTLTETEAEELRHALWRLCNHQDAEVLAELDDGEPLNELFQHLRMFLS